METKIEPRIDTETEKNMVEMYMHGFICEQIRKKFECSSYDVKRALCKNNIYPRKVHAKKYEELQEFERKRICNMYDKGMDIRRISSRTRCSSDIIAQVVFGKADIALLYESDVADTDMEEKPPINCDKQGKKCIYKIKLSNCNACDYLCQVGHSRGCEPTECTKYKFRKPRKGK